MEDGATTGDKVKSSCPVGSTTTQHGGVLPIRGVGQEKRWTRGSGLHADALARGLGSL